MESTTFSHPSTHFRKDNRARLKALLDEKYIHTPQNREMWWILEDLMFQVNRDNPKSKVMGCLITGEPHSGKTTAVRQFKQAYLDNVRESKPNDVVLFQIPSRARLKGVLIKLGMLLKIPDISVNTKRGHPTYILTDKIAKKLWKNEVKLLIMDEFQNLFELPGESRVEILSGFNELVNLSHIPIILVGVKGVDKILDVGKYYEDKANLHGTFSSRFMNFNLEAWDNPHESDFVILLKTIYSYCGLNLDKNSSVFYKNAKIREWIINATDGLTGKIIYIIKWSARHIIRNNLPEMLTLPIFKKGLKALQSER